MALSKKFFSALDEVTKNLPKEVSEAAKKELTSQAEQGILKPAGRTGWNGALEKSETIQKLRQAEQYKDLDPGVAIIEGNPRVPSNSKSTPSRKNTPTNEANSSKKNQKAEKQTNKEEEDSFLARMGIGKNAYQKANAENIDAAFAGKSGEHFNASVNDILGQESAGRSERFFTERMSKDRKNLEADLRGAKSQEDFNKILSDRGISAEGDLGENIANYYSNRFKEGPGLQDHFKAAYGPQITMTGVVGASVLKMSQNRGRVSNSQLYSDPF